MKKVCKYAGVVFLLSFGQAARIAAQTPESKPADAKPAAETPAPKEETSVTDHTIHIGGQAIAYKATVGTIMLRNEKDEPTALMFYEAYTKSEVKDAGQRPLAFLYNGGPGSSSLWIQMGAFGPRRVATSDAAYTPPAPYQLTDNPYSLLDHADLVFIDPVGTGFSRAVGKSQDKDFWGVDQDVHSLAQFINTYVTRNSRWNSPKFLIGESYGTFRSAALSNYLQAHDNMDFNGIVLVSSVLDLGTISFLAGDDLSYILYLPSYAATAWYHKVLTDRPADLNAFLAEARQCAAGEYASALMKGSKISDAEKAAVAKKLAHFTGLSEDYIIKGDLRIVLPQFMAELQRSRGLNTGRLDSRFSGPMYDALTEYGESDPQSDAISGPFTGAFNTYVHDELKFSQERPYLPESGTANGQWDWKRQNGGGFGFPGSPNTELDLVQAMLRNPHLQIEVENGIYDLATPFFESEYTMDHLGLKPNLRKNIDLKYYEAGHMMYVHDESLAKLKANVAAFIDRASGKQ
jgi:carboxypeptidase C (cathepsin A)